MRKPILLEEGWYDAELRSVSIEGGQVRYTFDVAGQRLSYCVPTKHSVYLKQADGANRISRVEPSESAAGATSLDRAQNAV